MEHGAAGARAPASAGGRPSGETRFALTVTTVFAAVAAFGAAHHEMWRDELQAWLVARDVPLRELFAHIHYEGHPSVWYLLLEPLTWATWSPVAMQVLHAAIATASVFVIARYAPWPRAQRAALVFGYFFLFEYLLICRNYAVGVLTLFASTALWPRRRERPLWLMLPLIVMAHSSAHALMLALGFAAVLAVELLIESVRREAPGLRRWLALAGIAAGLVAAFLQFRPPADSRWLRALRLSFDPAGAKEVLASYAHALVPVPRDVPAFWHSFVIDDAPTLLALLPLAWIGCSLLAFVRSWRASLFFGLVTPALALLFHCVYPGYVRHHGFFLMTWLGAWWLLRQEPAAAPARGWRRIPHLAERGLALAFVPLLAVQLLAGFRAFRGDVREVFSPARDAAHFLRTQGLADRPMAGALHPIPPSVLAYLGGRSMYYPECERTGSYILWDRHYEDLSPDAVMARIAARAVAGEEWVLVMNEPFPDALVSRYPLRELARFSGVVDHWEALFVLYLYREPARG